jgi:hypothetical protein
VNVGEQGVNGDRDKADGLIGESKGMTEREKDG